MIILTISNNIKISNITDQLKQILVNKLKFDNPKFIEAQNNGYSTWGVNKYIYNFSMASNEDMLVPRGIRKNLLSIVENLELPYKVIDKTTIFERNYDIDSRNIKYRPYQEDALVKLISEREGLLVAPAGSGKTIMGVSLLSLLGQPMLWLTHTDRLIKQTLERLETVYPTLRDEDIGFIGAGKWSVGNLFTIALVQTLIRNQEKLQSLKDLFGIVVTDEAHHVSSETFYSVINKLNPYYLYGLTATPFRRDRLEPLMYQTIGETQTTIAVDDVAHYGGIIKPKVIYIPVRSPEYKTTNTAMLLAKHIVPNKTRNNIIVSDVVKEAIDGNFCIVISDRREHCEILYELINIAWKKTGVVTGKYNKKHIDEHVKKFENGEITVLITTFALLGEGFDIPFLNRAFITMPFRAAGKVEQLIGRIQRTADGKEDAIIYDYVDVDIPVFKSQFFTHVDRDCRWNIYKKLGLNILPYSDSETK